jgi:hypothetical protein
VLRKNAALRGAFCTNGAKKNRFNGDSAESGGYVQIGHNRADRAERMPALGAMEPSGGLKIFH